MIREELIRNYQSCLYYEDSGIASIEIETERGPLSNETRFQTSFGRHKRFTFVCEKRAGPKGGELGFFESYQIDFDWQTCLLKRRRRHNIPEGFIEDLRQTSLEQAFHQVSVASENTINFVPRLLLAGELNHFFQSVEVLDENDSGLELELTNLYGVALAWLEKSLLFDRVLFYPKYSEEVIAIRDRILREHNSPIPSASPGVSEIRYHKRQGAFVPVESMPRIIS